MSGGAYDYAFARIEELADAIERRANDPRRLAFARLLRACADAAYQIEWVDSGDTSEGSEIPALEAALSFNGREEVSRVVTEQLREATGHAQEILATLEGSDQ